VLPVNVSALEHTVDQLFGVIEALGEELTAWPPASRPAFLFASGAVLVTACEIARSRVQKRESGTVASANGWRDPSWTWLRDAPPS
jgi:hypothetical protein